MIEADKVLDKGFGLVVPPPAMKVSEWADTYRKLSPEASLESGQWSTNRAPYQRFMMDAINDPKIHTIVHMTSSQVGKTEGQLNILGYFIDFDPAPILVVQPTIKMGETFSKDRLTPMLRDSPSLAEKVVGKSRNGENTIFHKKFRGGHVSIAGANSAASLASRPIRILLCDEIDRWPASVGGASGEGDPLNIAKKRTTTFYNRKIILSSTPGNKYVEGEGGSRIEFAWNQSNQCFYFVPCPYCNNMQTLEWDQFRWDKDDDGLDLPQTARYECLECKEAILDHHKMKMLTKGEWRASKESDGIAGLFIWEAYSPWRTLSDIVSDYLEAKDDLELYKVWVNTCLGKPFENKAGDQPDWEKLYERREERAEGKIPSQVLVLTAGVDVQKDRLEISVFGWNRKQSWLIEHRKILGDTAGDEVWEELTKMLDEDYEHPCGEAIPIRALGIDSGYQTSRVYEWVRTQHKRRVFALKGSDSLEVPIAPPKTVDVNFKGKRARRGVFLWRAGVSVLKSELYGRLNLNRPTQKTIDEKGYPRSYIHFPQMCEDYFKQLTAETCVLEKTSSGHTKYVWKKIYTINEALDCCVYSMAVYYAVGINKWSEEKWEEIERYLRTES